MIELGLPDFGYMNKLLDDGVSVLVLATQNGVTIYHKQKDTADVEKEAEEPFVRYIFMKVINEKGDAKILACCDASGDHVRKAFAEVQEGKLLQIVVEAKLIDENGKDMEKIMSEPHQQVEPKLYEIALPEGAEADAGAFMSLVYL